MVNGHSTEEWELGCSDPRQDISCTIAGVTTDGDGLAHQVFVYPVSHGFFRSRVYPCRRFATTSCVLVWELADTT